MQVIGSIILLEFNSLDPERMRYQLGRMWAALQFQFGAAVPAYAEHWEASKARRFQTCTTPVLVLLAVDWTQWAPLDSAAFTRLYSRSVACRASIQHTVHQVHGMLTALAAGDSFARHRPRTWYIQPMDAAAEENNLKCGHFAGINWLVRVITAAREQP